VPDPGTPSGTKLFSDTRTGLHPDRTGSRLAAGLSQAGTGALVPRQRTGLAPQKRPVFRGAANWHGSRYRRVQDETTMSTDPMATRLTARRVRPMALPALAVLSRRGRRVAALHTRRCFSGSTQQFLQHVRRAEVFLTRGGGGQGGPAVSAAPSLPVGTLCDPGLPNLCRRTRNHHDSAD